MVKKKEGDIYQKLGITRKGVDNKTENTIVVLYKSIFCPQNEYGVQL